jgi:UDPglucose--hexose-1-phosphate uridylyltransferase
MKLSNLSHSRKNLLTGEWILVSPQRLERPWRGNIDEPETDELPVHDVDCYLCPGSRRANDIINPEYTGPYIFDNDFSALSTDSENIQTGHPVFEARSERGHCKVVCYTERHDLRLSTMSPGAVESAVVAMTREFAVLDEREDTAYVQVFENRGKMMGCSNPHPHAQIWATEHLPTEISKELHEQGRWLAVHHSPLLMDYCQAEIGDGARIVTTNDHFVALVPYWATWPYETMILPRRVFGAPTDMTADEVSSFADILKSVLAACDRLFATAAPYSMGLHPRPSDGEEHPEWVFHTHIYPPLLRSSSIRKHMVGFEMLAMPQRDITPEAAAEKLRELF